MNQNQISLPKIVFLLSHIRFDNFDIVGGQHDHVEATVDKRLGQVHQRCLEDTCKGSGIPVLITSEANLKLTTKKTKKNKGISQTTTATKSTTKSKTTATTTATTTTATKPTTKQQKQQQLSLPHLTFVIGVSGDIQATRLAFKSGKDWKKVFGMIEQIRRGNADGGQGEQRT